MKLLEAENLKKQFFSNQNSGMSLAVNHVSFHLEQGEFLGLVGESGSGKSTIARMTAGLLAPDEGTIRLKGKTLHYPYHRDTYRTMQMVFQMPGDSFDPRWRMGKTMDTVLRHLGKSGDRQARAEELFEMVGLAPSYLDKYPAQMSGGECQRAAIARALAAEPELLICDEITSALDVSVQAQIVELLMNLRQKTKIAVLFISHDLALVQGLCDRIMVMKDGVIVEEGEAGEVLRSPKEWYTKQLIGAVISIEEG